MRGKWTGIAMVVGIALSVTTACSPAITATTSSSNQTLKRAQTNETASSSVGNIGNLNAGVGTPANTPTENSTSSNSSVGNSTVLNAQSLDSASMRKIASGLIERYVQSHNDKTLDQYKIDVGQIFTSGLANFVAMSARPGVDYDHPIKSHRLTLASVYAQGSQTFVAQATLNLVFQNGQAETHHYQFMFSPSATGQWAIQAMRGQ